MSSQEYDIRDRSGKTNVRGTIHPAPGGPGSMRIVTVTAAWNTPNIVAGIPIYTPTAGDCLWFFGISVPTVAFDGTTPSLYLSTALGKANGNAMSFSSVAATDTDALGTGEVGQGSSNTIGAGSLFFVVIPNPWILYLADNGGGDPGSTMGAAVVKVGIIPAP
jgi:hypothetical protein